MKIYNNKKYTMIYRPEKIHRIKWLGQYFDIWIFFVLVHISAERRFKENVNLCHLSKECICQKHVGLLVEDGITHARCKNFTTSSLDKFNTENLTSLTLLEGTTGSINEVLEKINDKKFAKLEDLNLIKNKLTQLDLTLIPENIKHLSFQRNGLQQIFLSHERNLSINSSGFLEKKHSFTSLHIFSENITAVPSNLPNSVVTLLISNCPLSAENLANVIWPKYLRRVKLINSLPMSIPDNMYKNIPETLKILWITHTPLSNGRMTKVPSSLDTLYIQESDVSTIEKADFKDSNNIKSLNLNGNRFEYGPNYVPTTLEYLFLRSNRIREVETGLWANLHHLTWLDISLNLLESVPLGLPSNLTYLDLRSNLIGFCDKESFSSMAKLKFLLLSNNILTIMPVGIHSGLTHYDLAKNRLMHVQGPEAYTFCDKCQNTNLSRNKWMCDENMLKMLLWFIRKNLDPDYGKDSCTALPEFQKEWLEEATKYVQYIKQPPFDECRFNIQEELICIDLDLEYFPVSPPVGPRKIKIVGNKKIVIIPDFIYINLDTLKSLNLMNNSLTRIPYGLPSSLQSLDLGENNITELNDRDDESFRNLTNLKWLYLNNNHIKTLYSTQMMPLTSLKWIGLQGNQWVCDCSLMSLVLWYIDLIPSYSTDKLFYSYATCDLPEKYRYQFLWSLYGVYAYDLFCIPPRCGWHYTKQVLNCSVHKQTTPSIFSVDTLVLGEQPMIPKNTFWEEIYLDGLGLTHDRVNLSHLEKLIYVDLSNNSLTKWPIEGLPPSLEKLTMKDNRIQYLPAGNELQEKLPALQFVDLRYNKITTFLTGQVSILPMIGQVYLEGNPFVCNCLLNSFISWMQANKNNYQVTKNYNLKTLTCRKPATLKNKLMMKMVIQEYCPQENFVTIGSLCGAIAFVMLIIIAVSVYLYKYRKRREKAEILLGFKQLLQQESGIVNCDEENANTHDCKYDCFVSYDNNAHDRQLVEIMIQELEVKRSFKLCLKERDFQPGLPVSDNIVECIGTSKRMILILSRDYVSSPWCQYEVQVALTKLHQKRSSKLLLAIKTEDFALEVLTRGMQTFLSLVPTHTYPANDLTEKDQKIFWEKLADSIA